MHCKVSDYHGIVKSVSWHEITSDFRTLDEEVKHKLGQLKPQAFQYNQNLGFLFTIVNNTMLTWNLAHTL